jgi:hypothetical protein
MLNRTIESSKIRRIHYILLCYTRPLIYAFGSECHSVDAIDPTYVCQNSRSRRAERRRNRARARAAPAARDVWCTEGVARQGRGRSRRLISLGTRVDVAANGDRSSKCAARTPLRQSRFDRISLNQWARYLVRCGRECQGQQRKRAWRGACVGRRWPYLRASCASCLVYL